MTRLRKLRKKYYEDNDVLMKQLIELRNKEMKYSDIAIQIREYELKRWQQSEANLLFYKEEYFKIRELLEKENERLKQRIKIADEKLKKADEKLKKLEREVVE